MLSVHPSDEEQATRPEEPAVSGNVFAPVLGLAGIGLLACTVWALGLSDGPMEHGSSLSRCGAITNDRERLACYDKLAAPQPPAKGAFGILHPNRHEKSQ